MNWQDRDFFNTDYFNDISTALKQKRFLQPNSAQNITDQIGLLIVDRVDAALATLPEDASLPLAESAITCFEHCVHYFPDQISTHLRNNAGTRSFHGLFATANLDVYAMWCRITIQTHSNWHTQNTWLHKLASALIRDCDLGSKISEAATCSRQGMSRKDTLVQIETRFRALDAQTVSAKSLLLLDLL